MPTPRNVPSRTSQRRPSLQDESPVRTRPGRGGKPATTQPDQPEFLPSNPSPTKLNSTSTRKTTRSASNMSARSFEVAPEVYASYEEPLLMVFGISPEFFDGLKKHHGKLPRERKSIVSSFPQRDLTPDEEGSESDSDEDSVDESEVEEHPVAHAAPRGRGRGGRGARGGRARGGRGRGRGRGGRPRGGLTRADSPARSRISRNAAPMVRLGGLIEEHDDGSPIYGASPNSSSNEDPPATHAIIDSADEDENALEDEDSDLEVCRKMIGLQEASATTESSAPPGSQGSFIRDTNRPTAAPKPEPEPGPSVKKSKTLAVPKISLVRQSGSQTPRESASTPAESAVPKLLRPEDDILSDFDLPEPWIDDLPPPIEAECEDRADYLLQTRFKPMVDVQDVIASLTKFPVSQRSTENLYALAENTQNILRQWQDQYLVLDARTAPHMHPAKKACNGGRIPMAPDVYEVIKEADLYGYTYDPKKPPEAQDPWGQRPGAEKSGGRELRTRRNRDQLDSALASEEEDYEDNDGRPAKRQRRATRKFDGSDAGTGVSTPKKHNGWGGARKKGVSRFLNNASETPEPESRPTKRARTAASNLLHQRIQEMRENSQIASSGEDESSAMDGDDYSDANVKRGRPAGSKNVARRSDYGVKKGPRKKASETITPVPSAHGPNAPPPVLQSMSEGQGQFTLDAQPLSEPPPLVANSAETVFQALPQPSAVHEVTAAQPDMYNTPDAYMHNNYDDETMPVGGSRRKPRVKSEKRSHSMTVWWAERKARKKEQEERNGTPSKGPDSRPGSSHSRRGGRVSTASATAGVSSATPSEPARRASMQYTEPPYHASAEAYSLHQSQPPTAPSPLYMYAPAPPPPPSHPMLLQYSPLAALPSGSYPFPVPPLLGAQYGSRALAPAPLQHQHQQQAPSYPSPYGPQSPVGPRPRSSDQPPRTGPPALAPAPSQHFGSYAPLSVGRDIPFKVMIPGQPPGESPRQGR
ncbi:hypothetical protein BDU57DRAFT_516808 [Ampelomyces quisqualis]|uniref:Uncharacterized protein n=1 Tax=Ampelomyces quisqualis TaxID=50730 RepID=A0A6A5QMP2_AMPQU|nr:hypothetical protein BDU57DRAFT_516808 [Ampelomyces quisqualis]